MTDAEKVQALPENRLFLLHTEVAWVFVSGLFAGEVALRVLTTARRY